MEYRLDTSHEKYIQVLVSGVIEKASLIAAISELMQHPDYLSKHSLWDLSETTLGLTIGDLKEIIGVLSLYKPEKNIFSNKSAIVIPGQMHKTMADLFITMAKQLPFKYRAFNEKIEATAFLCSE